MRKTSYGITFVAVVATLILNIISARRHDWLVVKSVNPVLHRRVTIRYGLMERCERQVIEVPVPGNGSTIAYTEYECRAFPAKVADRCEDENRTFCTAWGSATYTTELGIGFATMTLIALAIGISTRSRRRRIWRAVAVLLALHATFQLVTFAIITDLWRTGHFRNMDDAKPHAGYILNALSWVVGYIVTVGVVTTGISADKGHRWAAGNRPYHPIPDDS